MKAKRILTTLVIVLGIAFLMSGPSFAKDSKELDEIKHAIQKHGAKWVAGETSISKLSEEEKENLVMQEDPESIEPDSFGLFADDVDAMEADAMEADAATAPAYFNWRNMYGKNWVTPVRHQGNCGSCWAFAVAAAQESLIIRLQNRPGYNLDLSEQVLLSCSGCGSCTGGYRDCASNYMRDKGLPLESCVKYTATNGTCNLPTCARSRYRINLWAWHTGSAPTVSALKAALLIGPINASMYVYNDFYSYKSGIYSYVKGAYLGSHAILIIGYDDVNKCFIVKNSWGTGWGEAGFFRIAYSQVTNLIKFGRSAISYL